MSYLDKKRSLRKNQTPWEAKLWRCLRNRQLNNIKFYRQVKIENFIVDFYCHQYRLVIELDGGHHNEDQSKIADRTRDLQLIRLGYHVLRFWNNEVDANLEGVLQSILEVTSPGLRPPSPERRGKSDGYNLPHPGPLLGGEGEQYE